MTDKELAEIKAFVSQSRRGEEGASYRTNKPLLKACDRIDALIAEIEQLREYIDKIGKKAYSEHAKGNDRGGRLYGIAEMCRKENIEKYLEQE